jgi:hypothetical protein
VFVVSNPWDMASCRLVYSQLRFQDLIILGLLKIWKQQTTPKRWYLPNNLQGVIFQKTLTFINTISRNSARPDNINKLPAFSIYVYPKMLVAPPVTSLNFALFSHYALHPSVVPFSRFVAGFHLRDGQSGSAQFFFS